MGGWFLGNVLPTPPLGWGYLESRLGLGLSSGLWRGGRVVFGKCPTHPSLRLGLNSRLGLGLSLVLWRGGWGVYQKPDPVDPMVAKYEHTCTNHEMTV